MKVNKITILLISALLAIWVGIGYLAYSYIKPDTPITNPKRYSNHTSSDTLAKPYTLLLTYPDPFGGTIHSHKSSVNIKPQSSSLPKPSAPKIEPTKSIIPNIQYLGLIEGNKKKSILIRINKEENIFTLGDKLMGYTILRATSDSLWLSNGKERQHLGRE